MRLFTILPMNLNEQSPERLYLGQVSISVNPIMLPVSIQFISQIGQILALDQKEILHLEMATEEAVSNVIQHFSDIPDKSERINIHCGLDDNQLVISIFERGIPFKNNHSQRYSTDSVESMDLPGLGQLLMSNVMDNVEFFNLGKRGKETRLTKILKSIPTELLEQINSRNSIKRIRENNPIIRKADLDDIEEICRLAWKCFGYSQRELLYDFNELLKKVQLGEFIPFVAFDSSGQNMIYQLGLQIDPSNRKVMELALAFSDTKYKSPDISRKVCDLVIAFFEENNLDGYYDKCVSMHSVSQKLSQIIMKTSPSAILFAYGPPRNIKMRNVAQQDWPTLVKHYRALNKSKTTIYPPKHHIAIINEIYSWIELEREYGKPKPAVVSETPSVEVDDSYENPNGAVLKIKQITSSTLSEIEREWHRCLNQMKNAVFIYLPLNDPACPKLVEDCESLGFFFGGIMPHVHFGGDRLFLQYIDPNISLGEIRIHGSKTEKLLLYINNEYEKVKKMSQMVS